MVPDALIHLERLRRFRGRRERETSILPLVNAFERELAREERALGGAGAAWERLVPPALAERTRVVSFSRGTLAVVADDAATAFELDRELRGGLEGALRAALRCGSLKVRVRTGG